MKSTPDNLAGDESIRALSAPLLDIIAKTPGLTELSMSTPGEFFLEINGSWERREVPEMSKTVCQRLIEAISFYVKQEIKEESPLLSTTLPTGERIQAIIPPACDPSQIVISIRVPDQAQGRTLQSYQDAGTFKQFKWIESRHAITHKELLTREDRILSQHLKDKNLLAFLHEAVLFKKTIAVIGDTGSGKTTLMKALCQLIPSQERLLTIEDARELMLPMHSNKAHLLYAKGGQAALRATPADLIAACMRLKPDRVLLAELRGAEAWDFLKLMTSGHAGSITSFHAKNCAVAADRWAFMCKEHRDAATISAREIKELVASTVDVIAHITLKKNYDKEGNFTGAQRFVSEIRFDPAAEIAKAVGQGVLHA
jgi:type IV secretion system protein VirB11